MSNTPETDHLEECDYRGFVSFLRDERERDEYREQTDALVDRLGATQERMIDAERERDEARNAFVMAIDEMVLVQSQLREVKREFDRLADVIKASTILIAAKGRHNTMLAYEGLKLAFESLTTTEP